MAELVTAVEPLRERVRAWRRAGESVGLIPTMGALHAGHLSLLRKAREEGCRRVVVSIFVNPTQFAPGEDFGRYPRSLEADLALCGPLSDLVFAPSAEVMYPAAQAAWVEPGPAAAGLCGPFRPGHFRGVLTVVAKFFHMVEPDLAYFGAKDFQQAVLIQQMIRDLAFPLGIRIGPTIREPDGLAMSSRNRYLSPADRQKALCLIRGLRAAERLASKGERSAAMLRTAIAGEVAQVPEAKVDYIEIVDPRSLSPLVRLEGPALAALAVCIGGTRLIDNLILNT